MSEIQSELPIPSRENIEKMAFTLAQIYPNCMIPAQFPDFIDNIYNKVYPKYLIYSVLSAGIKHINNDRSMEPIYAKNSLELVRNEKDSSNPLILWACMFLISYTAEAHDIKTNSFSQVLANAFVRRTRIYQLDIKKKVNRTSLSEKDLEFVRRVWWSYYNNTAADTMFRGKFHAIDQRDIMVKLPKNDFLWRYGGLVTPKSDYFLDIYKSIQEGEKHYKDIYGVNIQTYVLFIKIISFLNKRWKKNIFDEDTSNTYFKKYLGIVNQHGQKLIENLPNLDSSLLETFERFKGSIKLNFILESTSLSYKIHQIYRSMAMHMYQSNLVRDSDIQIHPEKVKTAKLKCLSLASNQIELFFWLYKNIPADHIKFSVTSIVVDGAIMMINTLFKDGRMDSYESLFNRMIETYKEFGEKSKVALSFVSFINFIADIKKKARKKNMDSPKLLEQMKPYSISKSDLDPWITPKYSSFFNISCCFNVNFSTLDVAEYLSQPLKEPIGSKGLSGIDNDKHLAESNEVVAGSFEYFFGSNRVDLEKKYRAPNINSLPTFRRSDLFTIINRYDIDPFYYRKSISNIKKEKNASTMTNSEIEKEIVERKKLQTESQIKMKVGTKSKRKIGIFSMNEMNREEIDELNRIEMDWS
ncbi:hypothetical protein BB559_006312 [Furculomyces boomerangus]|uniref:Transcription factor domain-containing protein n=1 Tax=Furculomyces boomerangus TaxID=61424 RepID=A0A2T9Y3V2_9FUNG|nr:hypothetical protein BB559_006312 [Furculomyces boomerangus]